MEERHMLAYTYMEKGVFELKEKSKPMLKEGQDAIVKVTLASICASDLHIKYGSVPKAVPALQWDMKWWVLLRVLEQKLLQ